MMDPLAAIKCDMALAGNARAQLEVIRKGTAKLAAAVRDGTLEKQILVDGVFEQAGNLGLIDIVGAGAVHIAISEGLSHHVNGSGGEQDKDGAAAALKLPLTRFKDVKFDPNREQYLVEGLIPYVGITVIWGPPKCGKSFWTFDLSMHISRDCLYRGRRVRKGVVVYCAFEGKEGFKKRSEAYRIKFGMANEDPPFYLLMITINMICDYQMLIDAIRFQIGDIEIAAVVLDTLNESLFGSESKDEDMASYIRAADAVVEAFNCAVPIVHHCGIDKSRPRGHTSLAGADDCQISIVRDAADNVVATVEHMKDDKEGDVIVSRLEVIEVGRDEDDKPITSCVVVPVDGAEAQTAAKTKEKQLSDKNVAALRCLHDCLGEKGKTWAQRFPWPEPDLVPKPSIGWSLDDPEPPPPARPDRIPDGLTVTLLEWRFFLERMSIISGHRQEFKRIHVTLENAKKIGTWDGFVWAVT